MKYVKKLSNFLLDFIWPQFCLGCKKEGSIFCQQCESQIKLLTPQKNPWDNYCHLYFDACYVCFDYQDKSLTKLIHNYKYNYLENISDILVKILHKQLTKINLDEKYIVVNVPLHPYKKRWRGFDQTEILAKKLSKKANLTYCDILKRVKKTKAQAKLSKIDRINNMHNAFEYKNIDNINKNTNIILIDDVVTTGSTLSQAAYTLKKSGFNNIICLVLAKN